MSLVALGTAASLIEFVVIALTKGVSGKPALRTWYNEFGFYAVGADILSVMIGISLVQLIFPGIYGWKLVGYAVAVQVIHDFLFYIGVIRPMPSGHNSIIDLFKKHAAQQSYNAILGDSVIIVSTVLLMEYLDNQYSDAWIAFLGLVAVYSLIYIVHTR